MGKKAKVIRRVKYARVTLDRKWEYGVIECMDNGQKVYKKHGVKDTLQAASAANNMSYGEVECFGKSLQERHEQRSTSTEQLPESELL